MTEQELAFNGRAATPLNPLDFCLDVLCLQRSRLVSDEELKALYYPLPGPLFVQDWAQVVPAILLDSALLNVDSLKMALVVKLDRVFREATPALKDAYLLVGQGLLEEPVARWNDAPPSVRRFAMSVGLCMNLASSIRENLDFELLARQEGAAHSAFGILGRELAVLCREHEVMCMELSHTSPRQSDQHPLSVFKHQAQPGSQNVSTELVVSAGNQYAAGVPGPGGSGPPSPFARRVRRAFEGANGLPSARRPGVHGQAGWQPGGLPVEGCVRLEDGQAAQGVPGLSYGLGSFAAPIPTDIGPFGPPVSSDVDWANSLPPRPASPCEFDWAHALPSGLLSAEGDWEPGGAGEASAPDWAGTRSATNWEGDGVIPTWERVGLACLAELGRTG